MGLSKADKQITKICPPQSLDFAGGNFFAGLQDGDGRGLRQFLVYRLGYGQAQDTVLVLCADVLRPDGIAHKEAPAAYVLRLGSWTWHGSS